VARNGAAEMHTVPGPRRRPGSESVVTASTPQPPEMESGGHAPTVRLVHRIEMMRFQGDWEDALEGSTSLRVAVTPTHLRGPEATTPDTNSAS